jgi:hypothetical protein
MFERMDADGDGAVSTQEFVGARGAGRGRRF